MTVQHVRLQLANHALESGPHQKIARQRLTANRRAVNAELETRGDFCQRLLGALAAGEAVGDDADVMAAVGLAVGEIEDMAENPADRRARCVQDTKRLTVNERHDQNQRSSTSTVSPGLRGVPGGTTKRAGPDDASMWVSVTRSRCARGEKPPAMATAVSTVMFGT